MEMATRLTERLPRDLSTCVLHLLRPGQRHKLRSLPEFASLFPPAVLSSPSLEDIETAEEVLCAALDGHLELLKAYHTASEGHGGITKQMWEWVAVMGAFGGRREVVTWA